MRVFFIVFLASLAAAPRSWAADPSPAEVFERRILPIFKSPKPSSCAQCHLAGVDLKDYVLPDAEKTFRNLRDQGLIDLDAPERSKIVKLIDMGSAREKGPASVHEKVRSAERAAFVAWITACAADAKLRAAPKLAEAERAGPLPDAVIRHARKDRLEVSFETNVWAYRFRCMNCHTEGTPQNDKLRQKHGDRVAWFKKAGPAATMEYLLASKLIDSADPEKSLLLRKPMGDDHGGGVKFAVGDDAYKGFRRWIEDVATIRSGKYKAANDLPTAETGPKRFGSDLWLKLENCPPAWGDKLLEARVFVWNAKANAFETEPVAVSDRVVFGKGKLWQHSLTLLAAPGSARAKTWAGGKPSLPEGKYLVRVYVDRAGKLAEDWRAELGEKEFAGAFPLRTAWREGYGAMTTIDASKPPR